MKPTAPGCARMPATSKDVCANLAVQRLWGMEIWVEIFFACCDHLGICPASSSCTFIFKSPTESHLSQKDWIPVSCCYNWISQNAIVQKRGSPGKAGISSSDLCSPVVVISECWRGTSQGSDPKDWHRAWPSSQQCPVALPVLIRLQDFWNEADSPSLKQKNLPTFIHVDRSLRSLLDPLGIGIIALMPWSSCHWGWLKHRGANTLPSISSM